MNIIQQSFDCLCVLLSPNVLFFFFPPKTNLKKKKKIQKQILLNAFVVLWYFVCLSKNEPTQRVISFCKENKKKKRIKPFSFFCFLLVFLITISFFFFFAFHLSMEKKRNGRWAKFKDEEAHKKLFVMESGVGEEQGRQ